MGRKPIEDKRVQLNRLVAGATGPLLASLAEQLEISEGRVIDRAIQMLAIAESFGPKAIEEAGVAQLVEQQPVKLEVASLTLAAGAKIRPRFLKRRTE